MRRPIGSLALLALAACDGGSASGRCGATGSGDISGAAVTVALNGVGSAFVIEAVVPGEPDPPVPTVILRESAAAHCSGAATEAVALAFPCGLTTDALVVQPGGDCAAGAHAQVSVVRDTGFVTYATTGTVQLTSVTGGVEGSFEAHFADEMISGEFCAATCDP